MVCRRRPNKGIVPAAADGGEGDVVGVAAVELVEIGLVLEAVVIVRRAGRLRVVLPRGAPARVGEAPRLVVRWGDCCSDGTLSARDRDEG